MTEDLGKVLASVAAMTAGNSTATPISLPQIDRVSAPEGSFGQTFRSELIASGVDTLPFSYGQDYVIFSPSITAGDRAKVMAVVAAHDPTKTLVAPDQDTISRRQFFQQLALQNDITEDEALAAVQSGAIPAKLESMIDELPASDQFNARMLLAGATTFKFSNPLTAALAAALTPPRTTEQMKALWSAAAQLV